MKKFFLSIFILFFLISSAAGYNWFDERYFELSVGAKYGISNNSMQINDILTKNVVIDLKKIASDMPSEGWTIDSYFVPEIAFKLNLRKFQIGLTTGADFWSSGSVSKDLFNYLGNGNSLYQIVGISQYINIDAFAYEEISIGFKVKEFKITAKPTFFVPVLHVGSSNGVLNVTNYSDGSLKVDYKSDLEIYSAFDISSGGNISPGVGFDLGVSVTYPLFDFLVLTGNARIPIIPGRLAYRTIQTTKLNFSTSMDKIVNGSLGDNNFSTSHDDSSSVSYFINRPMKFSAFADFSPFGDWIIFTGGLGIGFRHPFTDDIDSFEYFGEYYIAGTLKFMEILKFKFSTEYYEKLFIHQFVFSANARILEFEFGINAQGAGFSKSCSGGGVGGLFAIKLGY